MRDFQVLVDTHRRGRAGYGREWREIGTSTSKILETPKNHRRHWVNFSEPQEDLNHWTKDHCTHNPPILLQLTPFPREAPPPPIPSQPHHSLHILVLYPLKKTPQKILPIPSYTTTPTPSFHRLNREKHETISPEISQEPI